MPELTAAKRARLRPSQFALPEQRKYPIPDVAHARNAKARAAQQLQRGNLSREQYRSIVRKADAVIAKQNGKKQEHGFWSANPGTGWWIVGGVVGAGIVAGGGLLVWKYVIKPRTVDLQGPKSAAEECVIAGEKNEHTICAYQDKNPTASSWYYFAVDSGPVSEKAYDSKEAALDAGRKHASLLDAMPVPTPDKPIPPILEEDEPAAGEGEDAGTLGDVPTPQTVSRMGTIADPAAQTVLVQSRPQWLAYARDYLSKLGWAELTPAAIAGTWSRAYPPSVGVGPGWTIAGRPFESLQQHAQVWLEDVNAGTYVTPADFDRWMAAATVTLGESPPEWQVFVEDVQPSNLLLAARPGAGDYTIAVRYVEEQLPDQTDRYWEWFAWAPGVLQLRENNAMERGRGAGRTEAIQNARDYVRNIQTASASWS